VCLLAAGVVLLLLALFWSLFTGNGHHLTYIGHL
jgi:hypothetical protein